VNPTLGLVIAIVTVAKFLGAWGVLWWARRRRS
jgi:hypothetical protein